MEKFCIRIDQKTIAQLVTNVGFDTLKTLEQQDNASQHSRISQTMFFFVDVV